MNWLSEIYLTIKWKIEDAVYAIKDKLNNDSYEDYILDEEVVVKPKNKKAKKKTKNKK
jgi:hypothetical protein